MRKHGLRIALLCAVAAALLSTGAMAAEIVNEGTCGENLTWTLDDAGVLTISGEGEMPNFKDEFTSPWARLRGIKSVVIENGVTHIGSYAFAAYTGFYLESVSLPDTLTSIASNAFYNCHGFERLAIPASVTNIARWAFLYCGLSAFDVAEENTQYASVDGVLFDKQMTKLIAYPKNRKGRTYAIPEGIGVIGPEAFCNCGLSTVEIPGTVTDIGENAFLHCPSLTEISIPDSVVSVGGQMFSGCVNLNSVRLGGGLTALSEKMFSECGMETIEIPNGVTVIGPRAFSGAALKSVTIPDSVAVIGDEAFLHCGNLLSVTIPKSVTRFGETVFNGCSAQRFDYDYDTPVTVRCYAGSFAERYAKANNLPLETLDELSRQTVRLSPEDGEEALIAAVRPDTEIVLSDGLYDISDSLRLESVSNLTIRAEHPGKAAITSQKGIAPVFWLENCYLIHLEGLILGHEWFGASECDGVGYVILAQDTDTLTVHQCDLWGCGVVATVLYDCVHVQVTDSILRDCRDEAIVISSCTDIYYANCVISGNGKSKSSYLGCIRSHSSPSGVLFQNCDFFNNYHTQLYLTPSYYNRDLRAWMEDPLIFENCAFHDNAWQLGENGQGAVSVQYGVCLGGVTWRLVPQDDSSQYTLCFGEELVFADGTTRTSTSADIPEYSDFARPWYPLWFWEEDIVDARGQHDPSPTPAPLPRTIAPGTERTIYSSTGKYTAAMDYSGAGLAVGGTYTIAYTFYDDAGKFLSADTREVTFDDTFRADIAIEGAEADTACKIFLLGDETSYAPQCNTAQLYFAGMPQQE